MGGRDVEVVDTGEVEDDSAQDGAGGNLVVVGDLAAARARVIPRAVLVHVRVWKRRVVTVRGTYTKLLIFVQLGAAGVLKDVDRELV